MQSELPPAESLQVEPFDTAADADAFARMALVAIACIAVVIFAVGVGIGALLVGTLGGACLGGGQ